MKKKVLTCIGTRPNIIKITQLQKQFQPYPHIEHILLHTGQHQDYKMNQVFFETLGIPKPQYFLQIEQGNSTQVLCNIMLAFEKALQEIQPDLVMVPGDVNSSYACAFVAARNNIPVAHIESGLRSFDNTMPEEQNRILIDAITDIFFVTEPSGYHHLIKEGKDKEKIHQVGNSMIDTLVAFAEVIDKNDIIQQLQVEAQQYIVATFHRPANVDVEENLKKVIQLLTEVSKQLKVIFPIHPRTRKRLEAMQLMSNLEENKNIIFTEALGYLEFMKLVKESKAVITDSGGVQEETTFMQIPCITVRSTTERPVTIDVGTNTLTNLDQTWIMDLVKQITTGTYKKGNIPEYWDGNTSERIAKVVAQYFS